MQIPKRHMRFAAQILSEKRTRRRYKPLPAIKSLTSDHREKHAPSPYSSSYIVPASEALEGGIPFGKYGSREMHES